VLQKARQFFGPPLPRGKEYFNLGGIHGLVRLREMLHETLTIYAPNGIFYGARPGQQNQDKIYNGFPEQVRLDSRVKTTLPPGIQLQDTIFADVEHVCVTVYSNGFDNSVSMTMQEVNQEVVSRMRTAVVNAPDLRTGMRNYFDDFRLNIDGNIGSDVGEVIETVPSLHRFLSNPGAAPQLFFHVDEDGGGGGGGSGGPGGYPGRAIEVEEIPAEELEEFSAEGAEYHFNQQRGSGKNISSDDNSDNVELDESVLEFYNAG